MIATEQYFPVVLIVSRYFGKLNLGIFWNVYLDCTESKRIKFQGKIRHDDNDDDYVRFRRR